VRYQFFLDARDYVKYGLLDDLMSRLGLLRLTFIWMLTQDIDNAHGNRAPHFDDNRPELNAFFQRTPRPHLWEVQDYFAQRGLICSSYGDRPSNYFTSANRQSYFASIEDNLLEDALVFLDPDNGVEPRSGSSALHVRLDELRMLWNRMNQNAILVIYQHKPRVLGDVFWPDVTQRASDSLKTPVIALPFGDIGFLVASTSDLRNRLQRAGLLRHQRVN